MQYKLVTVLLSLCALLVSALPAVSEDFVLPNMPLATETLGVEPNILLMVGESRTMSYGGGGSDVFYPPGYDPRRIYKCSDESKNLTPDEAKVVKVLINANALNGVYASPFFTYGNENEYYTWNHKARGSYGNGLDPFKLKGGKCFWPDKEYNAVLRTQPTGHAWRYIYWPHNSSAPIERLSGNFLNWYFSKSQAKWADNSLTGGFTHNLSGDDQGGFTTTSNVASSKNKVEPSGAQLSLAKGYSGFIGMKRNVTYQQERISVARDIVKKVIRDMGVEIPESELEDYWEEAREPRNANVALAAFSTRYNDGLFGSSELESYRHVLDLKVLSEFTPLTTDNPDINSQKASMLQSASQLHANAAAVGDAGKLYLPMTNALVAAADYFFKGWSRETEFALSDGSSEATTMTLEKALSTGSSKAHSQAKFRGVSNTEKQITNTSWCQKNAVVFLTDGLANDGPILIGERHYEQNLATRGPWSDYKPRNLNQAEHERLDAMKAKGETYEVIGAYHKCEKCEQSFIRTAGAFYDHDFLPDLPGKQNIETYIIGFGDSRTFSDDSLIMAGKAGGRNNFYLAKNGLDIMDAFDDIVARVVGAPVSLSAVAASTTTKNADLSKSVAVQASYDTEYWHSELKGYRIQADGTFLNAAGISQTSVSGIEPLWNANEKLSKTYLEENEAGESIQDRIKKRKVYTYNRDRSVIKGVRFDPENFSDLPSEMQADFKRLTGGVAQKNKNLMMYFLGDITNEENFPAEDASNEYRARGAYSQEAEQAKNGVKVLAGGLLGDIVNSSPIYIKEPTRDWKDERDVEGNARYSKFAQLHGEHRAPMIYAGDNRGMMHGFNAETGEEVFAYIPSMLADASKPIPKEKPGEDVKGLAFLASKAYEHRFYVDAQPTISDVFVDFYNTVNPKPEWRTVLVGGLGAGGKGIYALDITCPYKYTGLESDACSEGFNEKNILWEFTADGTDGAGDADLGYTLAQPLIAKVNYNTDTSMPEVNGAGNGRWAVIMPNGYGSLAGKPVLFILFLDGGLDGSWEPGKDYAKIVMGSAADGDWGDNGLSEPVAIDEDGDGLVDIVYAGDLHGNMWSIDLRKGLSYVE